MASDRPYYSVRTGKRNGRIELSLDQLRMLFFNIYDDLDRREFFQESFGKFCVDAGPNLIPGTLGIYVEVEVARKLRRDDLWPVREKYQQYTEEDIFDLIEFLFDHVSKPLDGYIHEWSGCGWHYSSFDRDAGKREFLTRMNEILRDYSSGFELSPEGYVLARADEGLEPLEAASLPVVDRENVEMRIHAAILKFRRHRASLDDRRDAIRSLADVLEFLRPRLKEVLDSKDEADLFNIANNFAIRHHNPSQKANYDRGIWYSWMFYFYLATIHAAVHLMKKTEAKPPTKPGA
jgi:hypothetical protein